MAEQDPARVLLVDDNPAIHADYRKVLGEDRRNDRFDEVDTLLFGDDEAEHTQQYAFDLQSAFQGKEALELVKASVDQGHPFSVALLDIRMPPGWDGVETAKRLWQIDPNILIIFCTAYSDYSWTEMTSSLQRRDQFVVLKKPFDNLELIQLVIALSKKWHLEQRADLEIGSFSRSFQHPPRRDFQSQDYLLQYVERVKLACIDMVYRQSRSDLHQSTADPQSAPPSYGPEFLTRVIEEVQNAASSVQSGLSNSDAAFRQQTVATANSQIIRILDNLLVLSQMDDNRFKPVSELFSLPELLQRVQNEFCGATWTQDQVELHAGIDNTENIWLEGDAERTKLILANILGSSLEQTELGAIELRASSTTSQNGQLWLKFTITNTGIGSHAMANRSVGEFFSAINDPRDTSVGLSLFVCKRLIDRMQGEISFEALPVGSCFEVVLPFVRREAPRKERSENHQAIESPLPAFELQLFNPQAEA